MTTTRIEVVRVEAGDGSIVKVPGRWSGHEYRFPIVYVLADGQRVETGDRHRLLRDAKAEQASLPKAPKHPTQAMFDGAGAFVGTEVSVRIGGA